VLALCAPPQPPEIIELYRNKVRNPESSCLLQCKAGPLKNGIITVHLAVEFEALRGQQEKELQKTEFPSCGVDDPNSRAC